MQERSVISTENSVYGSQFSVYITTEFAAMRFSIIYWRSAALFILMCFAYIMKRALEQITTLQRVSPFSPHLRYCLTLRNSL